MHAGVRRRGPDVQQQAHRRTGRRGEAGKQAVADWAANAQLYSMQVAAALDDWTSSGYRNEVEEINAYIDQTTEKSMLLWKRDLERFYEEADTDALGPGQSFYYTTVVPGDFASSDGWTAYSMYHQMVDSHSHYETTSWSAGGGSTSVCGARVRASPPTPRTTARITRSTTSRCPSRWRRCRSYGRGSTRSSWRTGAGTCARGRAGTTTRCRPTAATRRRAASSATPPGPVRQEPHHPLRVPGPGVADPPEFGVGRRERRLGPVHREGQL